MLRLFGFIFCLLVSFDAWAQRGGLAPPDKYAIADFATSLIYRGTNGLTPRSQTINPALKTLVLIWDGQSNQMNVTPTTYVPANSSAIDNFNIYDSASYPPTGIAMLGCGISAGAPYGFGHIGLRVADTFITNGIFDRVVIVPIAIGATTIADHVTGTLAGRVTATMNRLISRGYSPGTTGLTFAYFWGQGESDTATSQSAYAASFATLVANLQGAGFSGRIFIAEETWFSGSVVAAVQAAQIAAVDGVTIFSGGNLDSLNATNRVADNSHFNDTGAAAAATLIYNAMHASGAPF